MGVRKSFKELPRPLRRTIGITLPVLLVLWLHALPTLHTWAKVLVGLSACGFIGFAVFVAAQMIQTGRGGKNAHTGVGVLLGFGLLSLYAVILSH